MSSTPERSRRAAPGALCLTIAIALWAASPPLVACAQTVFIVAGTLGPHDMVSSASDDEIRELTGASVRRSEASLDELSLAVGCSGPPEGPACIAAIAAAAHADLVVVEDVTGSASPYGVRATVYGRDGGRLRVLSLRCTAGGCFPPDEGPPEPTMVSHDPLTAAPVVRTSPGEPRRASGPEPARLRTEDPVETADDRESGFEIRTSTVLFGAAALASVGAAVAGAVAVDAASDAAGLGRVRNRAEADQLVSLEGQRDVSLGTAIAFATVGAGLALTGLVVAVSRADVRVAAVPTAEGAHVLVAGSF